jgi:predicted secreted protein
MSLTFTEPVIARMHGPDGEPALLEISNVRDGLAAIRHDLGCGQCSTTEWQRAVDRLVKAALNPSSACIEEARQALLELVNWAP